MSYHAGDISNPETIQSLLDELKSRVIIHAAAPSGHAVTGNPSVYRETNIKGTTNLLAYAARVCSPVAFVYTPTSVVIVGSEHNLADESSPVLNASSKENEYAKTKAIADTLVLEANDPDIETENGLASASQPCTGKEIHKSPRIYWAFLRRGENRFQLGDNSNLFDWVHVENAAMAHILAAKALVAESASQKTEEDRALNVSGEAFFITDDAPLPFWGLPRKMWAAAGHPISTDNKVWVIPTKWALRSAMAVEWIVWAISLGTKRPQTFSRQAVEYCCLTRTYCIDKAKKRLGYAARDNVEEGVRQAVAWALKDEPLELGRKKRTKQTLESNKLA